MSTEKKSKDGVWLSIFVSDPEAFMSAVGKLRQQGRGITVSRAIEKAVIAHAGKSDVIPPDQDELDDLKVLRVLSRQGAMTEREVFNYVHGSVMSRERVAASLARMLKAGKVEGVSGSRTMRYRVMGEGSND